MKLREGGRHRRIFSPLPLAAMGDIAFLLIIFFMIAAQFAKESHVKMERPKAPQLEKLEKTSVSVSLDRDGVLWLDGSEVDPAGLQAEITAKLENVTDRMVFLKVDKDLLKPAYEPVFVAITKAGATISMVGNDDKKK